MPINELSKPVTYDLWSGQYNQHTKDVDMTVNPFPKPHVVGYKTSNIFHFVKNEAMSRETPIEMVPPIRMIYFGAMILFLTRYVPGKFPNTVKIKYSENTV